MRPLLVCLLLTGTGCAVRGPHTYRLSREANAPILVPPGVASPGWTRLRVDTDVRAGRGPCTLQDPAIEIRRRGKHVRLFISRAPLRARPAGWLSQWTAQAEEHGCIPTGEGLKLGTRIVESLPLYPAGAHILLRPSDVKTGYVDLGPETRLEVVGPILREGTSADAPVIEAAKITGLTVEVKASDNLIGFEKSWFALRPKPDAPGFTTIALGCERTIKGKTETAPAPAVNYLRFPPEAGFYRLVYKADRTIAVVFAATRPELDRRTDRCDELQPPTCLLLPRNVALNPNLVVTVNGREVQVPVGATLRRAIFAEERRPEAVLPRLKLQKPYRGRPAPVEFDPASPDILDLVLMGGETVTWK